MTIIDKSLEVFKEYKSNFDKYRTETLSESDTRSKILDKLLIDVLGWSETDIKREGYVKVGFFDYELSTSTFKFVIEAKKTLEVLKLPDKGDKFKIKTLLKGNGEFIKQIRNYIIHRDLSYGVISNGHQFIIGKFVNTDGSSWEENECYVFQTLDKIEKNFIAFYGLLSKESILHNGRIKLFEDSHIGKRIAKSSQIDKRDEELIRNDLSAHIVPIISQIFREIDNPDELNNYETLKACYIKNEDVEKHNSELNILFEDNPPTFDARVLRVRNTENTQKQIKEAICQQQNNIFDPIIIIGGKGVGKTTFIKYFTEVILTKDIKRNRPILYLDFRNYTKQQIQDTKTIYANILNQLYEKYTDLNLSNFNILRTIYQKEIQRKIDGIWNPFKDKKEVLDSKISTFLEELLKDNIENLIKVSKYLISKCRKKLCVIFDNADQLDGESQKEVFLLAQSIHRNVDCLVIISLREGYFYRWKNKPPFDAYHSNIFHITAPSYREVLKKRLEYVIKNFNFNNIKEIKGYNNNKLFELSGSCLSNLFKSLYKTLFNVGNSEVLRFLEETSYPNIRDGLEKFNLFLISGHTKIVDYMMSDSYNIPIWEFIKSVALESKYYYQHENHSCIYNMFNPCKNNKNHFTKIRLLNYLYNIAESTSYKEHYTVCDYHINLFIKAGYTKEIILNELSELLEFKLIETKNLSSDIEDDSNLYENSEIKITQAGIYYIKELINRFHYIDLVLQDTPIYDDQYYEQLLNVFPQSDHSGNRDINARVNCVKIFLDYLKKQEILDHTRNKLNLGEKALDLQIVDSIYNGGLKHDLERIKVKT